MKKFNRNGMLNMNLQLFAEPGGTGGDPTPPTPQPAAQQQGQPQTASIDYAKIQQMLEGTLSAKEDTALKAYFKQQGLSQEEMNQAIAAFKQQKAAQQPDVGAIQTQLTQAQTIAQQAQVQSAATMAAVTLGIEAKTIPYVLKMADLGQAMGQDGKINEETLTNALKKVLDDIPVLKPQAAGTKGFIQVGASGGGQQQTNNEDALKKAFGL